MTNDFKGYKSKSEMRRVERMKESGPQCPKCGSKHLTVERRPDGNAICGDCLWQGPYSDCFGKERPLDYEEMARVVHLYLKAWCDESLPYPDMCADAVRKVRAAFDSLKEKLEAAEKMNKIYEEALEWYADRKNWMRSWIGAHNGEVIPAPWADKLKEQDCAMLNCGGGRARLALSEAKGMRDGE